MDKEQFDNFLGGSQELPHEANILKIASARANEIAAMTNSLENPQQTKLIFQKLPRHMRRRIMSHNVKRMPRRLRESHRNQMLKSGLPAEKNKVPSRKHRRRPRNLLLEYNRRKRDKFWLETHIWHAKRFKMIEKWGFKVAEHPNDKCFKANYKAVASHSLIQDISYYTCVEILGPLEILISSLQKHCDPSFNFREESFLKGEKEKSIMFYKKDEFPYFPLGNINFMWKPEHSNESVTFSTIWLWIHPGIYQEIFYDLVSNFKFQLISPADSEEIFEEENFKDVNKMPSAFKIPKEMKLPVFKNGGECKMTILRNSLNRFRISGPLTLCALTDALKLPNIGIESNIESIDKSMNGNAEVMLECQENDWSRHYYSKPENVKAFKVQKGIFEKLKTLKSPNQIPDSSIIALTVLDPRFFAPDKRTKSHLKIETEDLYLEQEENVLPELVNHSGIWDDEIRSNVTQNCLATSQINKMRREVLIPGMENDEWFSEEKMQKIPILLIHKPGIRNPGGVIYRRNGFASGFDVIIPQNWALSFWLSFIFRCVRPGGLRESRSLIFETLNMSAPDIFHPGTPAYEREAIHQQQLLKDNYFKNPPNRRVNFTKFAITTPFLCEWGILAKEWGAQGEFSTLRDKDLLQNLNDNLMPRKRKSFLKMKTCSNIEPLSFKVHNNYLVPVKVTIERKGVPDDFSIICLPTEDDLKTFKMNRKWSGPMERLKSDSKENERLDSRKKHLELLKKLRKQRVRMKKRISSMRNESDESDEEFINKIEIIRKKCLIGNKSIVETQARKMQELCLPKCSGVRFSCDRQVIGFVEQGGFCISEARGVGRGYVVLKALNNLIIENTNLVLIRNTQTRKYRLANLQILIS
ncbi:ribonucleases P/MRP protein subunit POP1 [Leptopilina heterotoma]|uniref:ribonucleases P/MRP protein subunit POP1 n=1 Tax=Leptopilina heterotoma TaxID=63436 RepID=UPI001CA9CBAD|nr:ribonucleases P/MRP protein subunit POP1 [Leptopilina heterotoma]